MAEIGGCPNVGGICIGCTMPGFPDKFMSFMNQPPGSLLSSAAVQTYGRAMQLLTGPDGVTTGLAFHPHLLTGQLVEVSGLD
jgi:Ni,Fe-hydrogenase I small subunit